MQRQGTTNGPWVNVRTAAYEYYTGEGSDAANGRLGDLRLVTIKDASGTAIDHTYYRYYKFNGYTKQSTNPTYNTPAKTGGTDSSFPAQAETTGTGGQPADNSVTSGVEVGVYGRSL